MGAVQVVVISSFVAVVPVTLGDSLIALFETDKVRATSALSKSMISPGHAEVAGSSISLGRKPNVTK